MADDSVVSNEDADDLISDSVRPPRQNPDPSDDVNGYTLGDYSEKLNDLRIADHELDSRLKKKIGEGVLKLLVAQLVVMDVVFVAYAITQVLFRGSELSDAVLIAWITTTIAQVIGLATVVAKYLFPGSGSNWTHEPRDD